MAKEAKEKKPVEKKTKASGKGERFADMSAGAVIIDEKAIEEELKKEPGKKEKKTKTRGKKYQQVVQKIDKTKTYPIKEAISLLKQISYFKPGGSVEVHLKVQAKGSWDVKLPYFQGKAKKVAVFNDQVLEEIKSGKIAFDVLYASPADMPKILPFAKILGPKGLLPNPQNGTLVPDPQKASQESSTSNLIKVKTEKDSPVVHAVIGKLDQKEEELVANFEALVKTINPRNILKAYLKSTMSPSIKINLNQA